MESIKGLKDEEIKKHKRNNDKSLKETDKEL